MIDEYLIEDMYEHIGKWKNIVNEIFQDKQLLFVIRKVCMI